jgi:hypothetical protein
VAIIKKNPAHKGTLACTIPWGEFNGDDDDDDDNDGRVLNKLSPSQSQLK